MNFIETMARYLRRGVSHAVWSGAVHTPLERLPMVAIDCETTGLDARRDRIVSFAAIRIDPGLRVSPQSDLDLLIDPGIDIPSRAVAVHGIDRAQLVGAPSFADAFERVVTSIAGAVVVGHHVAFDLAILGREAARARRPWREPPSFDTANLAAALGHPTDHVDLDVVLGHLGVEPKGRRHSAAGDARRAADLFVVLAHHLIGQGHGTFGGVIAAHRSPRR